MKLISRKIENMVNIGVRNRKTGLGGGFGLSLFPEIQSISHSQLVSELKQYISICSLQCAKDLLFKYGIERISELPSSKVISFTAEMRFNLLLKRCPGEG
tara:strand:+ start:577 stop:876 length:300 start_codon:yes stop_codon:yes gene_type:complete